MTLITLESLSSLSSTPSRTCGPAVKALCVKALQGDWQETAAQSVRRGHREADLL